MLPPLEEKLQRELAELLLVLQKGEISAAGERLEEIAAEATGAGLHQVVAHARVIEASIRLERGEIDRALKLFQEAERLLSSNHASQRIAAVAGIARCCHLTGRTMYALQLLEAYLVDLEIEGGDAAASMRAHATLVGCYQALGMMRQASNAATKAMEFAKNVDDELEIACMNMNVARVLLDQGLYPEAVEAIEKAEDIYEREQWSISAARARSKRGIVEAERGNLDRARAALIESLEHLAATGITKIDRAYALDELGRVERLLGHLDEAKRRLYEARPLLDERDHVEHGMNSRELGLCLASEDPDAAMEELESALRHYQEAGASAQVATTMLYLGRILKDRGQLASALDVFDLRLDPAEKPET